VVIDAIYQFDLSKREKEIMTSGADQEDKRYWRSLLVIKQ
jgi:hypothetical protein